MKGKRVRRICKVLYAVAILLNVVSIIGIVCSLLCIANGRLAAIITLIMFVGLVLSASEFADAIKERIG